jgi:glycosyltransferase involved in cell wall biosynthesis
MEKLLHRCLDSIIVESVMDKVQVIVVNDGSKDKTSEIAHEYEVKYPSYIQVVDKENGNYGSCMNVGLSLTEGKYFRTLDADDWYDTSLFEQYIDQLSQTDADLVLSERLEVKLKTNWKSHVAFDADVRTNEDLPVSSDIWKNQSVLKAAYVMGFAYKTSVLRQSQLHWTDKIFYTDAEYCVWPLPYIQTVRFISIPLYVYVRDVEGQSTNSSLRIRNLTHYFQVSKKILNYYLQTANDKVSGLMEKFLIVDLLDNVYPTLVLDGLKYKKIIDEFEGLVRQSNELYRRTGLYHHYRGYKYVDCYRHNKIKYILIRLDYLIRSNKMLRSVLCKR